MNLLIAEDDSDIALVYRKGLDMKNYKVTIASNGEDCLKIYNEELHKITFDNNHGNQLYCGSFCSFLLLSKVVQVLAIIQRIWTEHPVRHQIRK